MSTQLDLHHSTVSALVLWILPSSSGHLPYPNTSSRLEEKLNTGFPQRPSDMYSYCLRAARPLYYSGQVCFAFGENFGILIFEN